MGDALMDDRHWGERARGHVRVLARGGRGSATEAEVEAARYVMGELVRLGVGDVRRQPFNGLRSIWLFLSLAFGMALVGHAAYWLIQTAMGGWIGLVICLMAFGMSGVMLWRKFTFRDAPLQEMLPHGPSQNVIGVIPARGETKQKVVLVSHLDSHRAVFWYASDWLVRIYAAATPVLVWGVAGAPLLYVLAVVTGWQVFGWLGLALGVLHFLGWFTGVTADLGPYSPGANDNAAAVGVVLSLAERLKEAPLEQTEVWLAFTGCEETGCGGMLSLLREHGEVLKEALFIDLELTGIGNRLVYLEAEGVVRKRRIPAEVEELVKKAGEKFGLKAAPGSAAGYFTEGGAAWEHGFKAVCLLTMIEGTNSLPEWHRLTDTPERLEVEALGRMGEMVWEVLGSLDKGQ